MTLLDQISDALGASGATGELSTTLGVTADETESLLGSGLRTVLGGLGAQSGGDGMGSLMALLKADGGSFVDSLGTFFSHGDKTGLASKLVGSLFGSQRGLVESHVASDSGADMSVVSRLLPMLAPAVLGYLAKIVKDDDLDGGGLSAKLAEIGATGPLGEVLVDVAKNEDNQAGFASGMAALKDAGGLAALVPAATTPAVAAAGTAVATTAGVGAGAGAVTMLSAPADDDTKRTGLAWLWTVVLPVLGLILGLVLWQCTSAANNVQPVADDGEDTEAPTEPESQEPEPAPEPEQEPTAAAEPEPEPEPTAAAEPTAEPEPEATATAVPATTIADLALANPELSRLVGFAEQLDLVEQLSDANAGPFTVFAPTNDAFAAADELLDRLDEDQTRTALSFHVVRGLVTQADLVPGATFETLTDGMLTVGEDGTLTGGVQIIQADVKADNGIVHIVENVLVPGSIQRALATEDVNALFVLDPIQFATGSAEILDESVATLDQAIATLTALPAGSKFEVQGHTDTSGGDELNQTLSEARAESVVAYLIDGGVDQDMLEARGYGETQPKVDPEESDEDRAANRRIEFVDISE